MAEIFGRDLLLGAKAKADKLEDEQKAESLARQAKDRMSLLGRTLVTATIEQLPFDRNGITLQPNKKRHNEFITALALGEDFDTSKLSLYARGDQASGWMSYQLSYSTLNGSGPNESVVQSEFGERFSADQTGHLDGSGVHSETNLYWGGEPVLFESEQYGFIRTISGLFFPEVVAVLKQQGL